jgi:hypothetical protein
MEITLSPRVARPLRQSIAIADRYEPAIVLVAVPERCHVLLTQARIPIMHFIPERRRAMRSLGLGLSAGMAALATAPDRASAAATPTLCPPGARSLRELTARLSAAPRRRDFKTVPMILSREDQWDHEALSEVLAYQPATKQAWDMTDIAGPWLNLMRNALNVQVWSFRHPDFLAVAECHGTAQLALYDQAMWDKYQFGLLTGGKFKTNTLLASHPAEALNPGDFENPAGPFSPADNSIPALMARGVVFMSCHNAIWEQSAALIRRGINPDRHSHEALAAELTNHLISGAVLTPGAVGTLPELQRAGFHYIA